MATYALGRNRRFYVSEEPTFGQFSKPSGDDAAKVTKATFSPAVERKLRSDSRQGRSHSEMITGKQTVGFSVEGYLIPYGSAPAAPDIGPLVKGAMGIETATAQAVVYSLSSGQTLPSFTMAQEFNELFSEAVGGAFVNSMGISISGGDEPKVTFEGEAAYYIATTSSPSDAGVGTTATIAASGSGSTFTVQTGEGKNFYPGSVVKIGTNPNNANVEIAVVNHATDTLTASVAIPGGFTAGDAIVPYVPDEVTHGSPIAGILGSLQLGVPGELAVIPITKFDVKLTNNNKGISDESFAPGVSGFIPGLRDVTGSLTIRCRHDLAVEIPKRLSHVPQAIVVACGEVSGSIVEISIPRAEFEVAAVDAPESDEVMIQLAFRALASAAGEDELTVTFK